MTEPTAINGIEVNSLPMHRSWIIRSGSFGLSDGLSEHSICRSFGMLLDFRDPKVFEGSEDV